ncbi:hypothetical protein BGZ76_009358 [Entomortierella beljakovae]|nr:hypothetical protein BGZ76_009358 [Entomortierella beljakovae]
MIFTKTLSFLSTYLLLLQILTLFSCNNVVQGAYSFSTPTAATRWVAGQAGQLTIVSTDKAKSATPTNDRLLTITLCKNKNIFQPNELVATIKDHVQLLIPFGSALTEVSLTINDFVVPSTIPAGQYHVRIVRDDGLFDRESENSPTFQIVAAAQPPAGNTTTTGLPTSTTLVPTATTSTTAPTPTSTLPAGQTCDDVKQQCAAQGKTYVEPTANTACTCGTALIVPTVINGATTTTTSGPNAALVVLLLVVMNLF